MVYNLKNVAVAYVEKFLEYVEYRSLEAVNYRVLSELLSYSVRAIYKIPYYKNNFYIVRYGGDCIAYLKRLKGVPKGLKRLSVEDRISIAELSSSYYLAVGMLIDKKERIDSLDGFKESL